MSCIKFFGFVAALILTSLLSGCMSPEAESDWHWKRMNPEWRSPVPPDGRPQWGPFW